jgi:hypothetical protein
VCVGFCSYNSVEKVSAQYVNGLLEEVRKKERGVENKEE